MVAADATCQTGQRAKCFPTGTGKSSPAPWLRRPCRDGHRTLYQRFPRLLQDLTLARHDGRYPKLMAILVKCEVLILDDLLISPMTRDDQRELLEIIEERYDRKSTIITSQLPVKSWHDAMQDPALGCHPGRLVHNAYKIEMTGNGDSEKKAKIA